VPLSATLLLAGARLAGCCAVFGLCAGVQVSCMPSQAVDSESRRLLPTVLSIEPSQIDLGTISQCDPPASVAVMLRNSTRQAVTLKAPVSTCSCTTTDLPAGTVLKPGDERELRVRLEPWGDGPKQQFVRLVGESGDLLGRVAISYRIRSPLRTRPSGVSRDVNPEGEFLVEVPSRTPFRVLSFDPPVAKARYEGAVSEQIVMIDWSAVDQLVQEGRPVSPLVTVDANGRWATLILTVRTDRRDCPDVFVMVRNTPQRGE
jgi:hypothetical protein